MAGSHIYWKGGVILEAANQGQWYECFVLYHIYIHTSIYMCAAEMYFLIKISELL